MVHSLPYQKTALMIEAIGLMKSDKNLQNTSQERAVSFGNNNVHDSIYED